MPRRGSARRLTWVGPDLSLSQAAKKMLDLDIVCLPVGKDDRSVGMVTDRDIVRRAVAKGRGLAKIVSTSLSRGVLAGHRGNVSHSDPAGP
jgi:CBS domain-containing protein